MSYAKQDRGGADDYAAYFAGMNQSMQQKVALTTAHFPPVGRVADMGSGSGQATFDLASLYGGLEMVGVDINVTSVEMSRRSFDRDNLRYVVGDIADKLFTDGYLDGILNSSVLHHVTSFNGFSVEPVERLLDNQVAELKDGGVLIIRDFVVPRGPREVQLELGDDDAALFERFARDFRSSQNRTGPVPYQRTGRVFTLSHRAAAEFVLRKDYRDHWDTELLEEYTYFTQAEFEAALRKRGMRVVVSVELHNPWIVEHRFRGRFTLRDSAGEQLPMPPTNYLIVGEKVAPGGGVVLAERAREPVDEPRFLKLRAFRNVETKQVFELVERPHRTVDVLPYFTLDGRLFVLAKHGFPRPITQAETLAPDLIGMTGAGYVTEPLAAIVADDKQRQAAVLTVLGERAGISPSQVHEVIAGFDYFPSPGGISERVQSSLVAITPWTTPRRIDNYSSFTDSGSVRFLDATQVLRACHVGGMIDARLELNIYRLLGHLGRPKGPWIGASVEVPAELQLDQPLTDIEAALALAPGARFVPANLDPAARFLSVYRGSFDERDAEGRTLASAEFEYVLPRTFSHNTLSVLPVSRVGGEVCVGLETRELPAVALHTGQSSLLTVPACRIPAHIARLDHAERFALDTLAVQYGLSFGRCLALGGRYAPSLGITPEVVYPYLAWVSRGGAGLRWVSAQQAVSHISRFHDAHLLTALLRFAHGSGILF